MTSRHPVTPVTRLRRAESGKDRYGDPVYEETSVELPPALFAPGGASEPVVSGREPVVTEPTVYWRGVWPDVVASDRLVVRGRVYEVVGDPADWRGNLVGGLVVRLMRVEEGDA